MPVLDPNVYQSAVSGFAVQISGCGVCRFRIDQDAAQEPTLEPNIHESAVSGFTVEVSACRVCTLTIERMRGSGVHRGCDTPHGQSGGQDRIIILTIMARLRDGTADHKRVQATNDHDSILSKFHHWKRCNLVHKTPFSR